MLPSMVKDPRSALVVSTPPMPGLQPTIPRISVTTATPAVILFVGLCFACCPLSISDSGSNLPEIVLMDC